MTATGDARRLAELLEGRTALALTGAGVSTDSGVPDYRGSGAPEAPSIEFDDFVGDEAWRRFLWFRNEQSWRLLEGIRPTGAQRALARLEAAGIVSGVSTQNVDRLHTAAGSVNVAELHGRFDQVVCVDCGSHLPRAEMSALIRELNPTTEFPTRHLAQIEILPPMDWEAARECHLNVPPCPECQGILKPDVVFFGEMLPARPMEQSIAWARAADVILVVGSSLVVTTGSWVLQAGFASGADVAIINRGPTAHDDLAVVRSYEGASEVLEETCRLLGIS